MSELEKDQERTPVLIFMDRVKFLIKTDENLTVAECVGALHLIAHELCKCAFEEEED
jgi:hypothetical protein